MVRRRAVERLTTDLDSWHGAPVFAYGFEDLTGAEWRLIEALAARGEVHVSLPYEPGRAVVRLAVPHRRRPRRARERGHRRAAGRRRGATCQLGSRTSSATSSTTAPLGRVSTARFASSKAPAGERRSSCVAETILDLVRDGVAPEEIAVVCPSLERSRASIETAFGSLGVPVAIEARPRLGTTAFGQALLSLLRFAWSNGTRRELFAFLRTPYGGLARPDVDFLEGRLRGRAVLRGDRTVEETTKLRTVARFRCSSF